ncbi:hypothetical protein [Acetobacter conturbans]|uniref:Uncharacterized protein n=1 Tax=Acetobacter conturbans TaxID=1737472 RepID=A0ABX0K4U6_9PROT|nr:hypothetical protein [Acetobacter conturbans]NHN89841.1 hypothetical protein [Acetobacter conturbans]
MEFLTPGEQTAARKLVRAARAAGYLVSVWEGEDFAIRRSDKESDILKNLGSTGQDRLDFIRPAASPDVKPTRVGWALLIYGNAPDGSELVADCSDNAATRALVGVAA